MNRRQTVGTIKKTEGDRALWSALALVVGWSAPRFLRFARRMGRQIRQWVDGEGPELASETFEFLTKRQRTALANIRHLGSRAMEEKARAWAGEVVLYGDDDYPEGLYDLKRPPAALHVRGRRGLLGGTDIAVVGSRKIGVAAASAARRILEPAAARGMVIVSGGALGADAMAHRCAVDASGSTVVVLPSGLSRLSPKSNRRLFYDIADNHGLLISEYPPDCGVRRYHFRRRNGLMAAMSRGVFVLRAAESSGTMLTVDAARDLGRPLAAMPGRPDDPLSRGCHDIVRDGGAMIADADDLLDWWRKLGGEVATPAADDDTESVGPARPDCAVLDCAEELVDAQGAFSVEALVRATGKSAAQLQAKLLEHELAGVIERTTGGDRFRFRRG